MICLCTLFDHRYLDRGLALHDSLQRQGNPFHLWILCMDATAYDALRSLALDNVSLLSVDDLANGDADLLIAKSNRTLVEFYFTCKSFLCLHILRNEPAVELLTYLDADTYFFQSPLAIEKEMAGYSIGLTPHRFSERMKRLECFGGFNAGFVSLRRDDVGMAALVWWRDRCFEWCHDVLSEGRFADQGYLDSLPKSFPKVNDKIRHGINTGPWNVLRHGVTASDTAVMLGQDVLVLFHFHGLRRLTETSYESGFASFSESLPSVVRHAIYEPYLKALANFAPSRIAIPATAPTPRGKTTALQRWLPWLQRQIQSGSQRYREWKYNSVVHMPDPAPEAHIRGGR